MSYQKVIRINNDTPYLYTIYQDYNESNLTLHNI